MSRRLKLKRARGTGNTKTQPGQVAKGIPVNSASESKPAGIVPNGGKAVGAQKAKAAVASCKLDSDVKGEVQNSSIELQAGNTIEGKRNRYQPFPVECLPPAIRDFVVGYAQAMDCDESYLALPALAVLAGAIGNTAQIRLSEFWNEPSILWTAVVADSGARKSPPLHAATKPMWDFQRWWSQRHIQELQQYRSDMATYNRRVQAALDQHEKIPRLPEEPVEQRFMVNDVAIEPLALLLERHPRGLMICRDELDGWLGGFDASRGGRGSGPARWLELHGGRPMIIDRRPGTNGKIDVPFASVSITGGIQPEILAMRLTRSHLANGLFARLLFAFPPARPRRWSETTVDRRVSQPYSAVVHKLLAIPFVPGVNGLQNPRVVELSPEATERFKQFVDEFGQEQNNAEQALQATFAKLEGYAARFALVLHLARWAATKDEEPGICDLTSLEHGITLSRWFANEARRICALIRETPEESEQRKLIGWLQRHGGEATSRDLARSSSRRYPTAEEATAALNQLAEAGLGSWRDRPTETIGGRPYRVFLLPDTTPVPGGCVRHEMSCPSSEDSENP